MGGRQVPCNLLVSGSTTRQFPKNQQLSGEAAEAGQGREQTCERPQVQRETLIGNNSSSHGARRASLAGSGARPSQMFPHGCSRHRSSRAGRAQADAGSKGSACGSPDPVCSTHGMFPG